MTETLTSYSKIPEFQSIGEIPIWWHQHGDKMRLNPWDQNPEKVIIRNGTVASLIIDGNVNASEQYLKDSLSLEWFVRSSKNEYSTGKRLMAPEIVRAAFGIGTFPEKRLSKWLLERFGGDSAHQGSFIRWQEYLNIPSPGTGHDHDPNISILIDDDMREAVNRLLILKVHHLVKLK